MSHGSAELTAMLEAAAAELEGVEVGAGTDASEWAIGGIVFAAAGPDGAEFRLAPPVASAALRTPDTLPSGRGADWVLFRPATLDGHAIDRATAWLASAWRRADGET
jgi:hypothetical protein